VLFIQNKVMDSCNAWNARLQRMTPDRRDFPGRRWLTIGLRSLHLAGVVLAGAALFGDGGYAVAGAALMLITGLALFGIELWHNPDHRRQLAGVFIPVKLLLVLGMLLVPNLAGLLFWLLLVSSTVVSHAPRLFRHRRVLP
jgi:hypothetical protein